MACSRCGAVPLDSQARFCTKCGATFEHAASPRRTWLWERFKSFSLARGRTLTWPLKKRGERIRWLSEASSPDSPINAVPGLSDAAKRVYSYLASVTLRYGASHSRISTIAKVAGLSEYKARQAIRELERRRLLSHSRRKTWHGRGANAYFVKPVGRRR